MRRLYNVHSFKFQPQSLMLNAIATKTSFGEFSAQLACIRKNQGGGVVERITTYLEARR